MSDFLSTHDFKKFLGSGSFGLVFSVQEKFTEQKLTTAVKLLFCDRSCPRKEELIDRECSLQDLSKHDNVVQIIETRNEHFTGQDVANQTVLRENENFMEKFKSNLKGGEGIDLIMIKMELCGSTLRQWLNINQRIKERNDLPNPNYKELAIIQTKIITQISEGLKFLHDNKMIHRDLKPENIMFSFISSSSVGHEENPGFDFPVKIGDFGLSRKMCENISKSMQSMTAGIGTGTYMAPEVRHGKYGTAADIYSLGLIIWEVLQLIPERDRKDYIYELVTENKHHLIDHNLPMENAKHIILKMTNHQVDYRMKNLDKFLKGQIHFAKSSEELQKLLKTCVDDDVIYMDEGKYEGLFEMNNDGVTLQGIGNVTFMKPPEERGINDDKDSTTENIKYILKVNANNCKLSDFQMETQLLEIGGIYVSGNSNKIFNIPMTNTTIGFHIQGNENSLENIKVSKCSTGILICGEKNIIHYIYMEHVAKGIHLSGGNYNKVSTYCWFNSELGVFIGADAHYQELIDIKDISVARGVSDSFNETNKLGLQVDEGSSHCRVSKYKCGKVSIAGMLHTLENLESSSDIIVNGSGHEMKLCTGKSITNFSNDLQTIDCNFGQEKNEMKV